jgi:hypothetical protein
VYVVANCFKVANCSSVVANDHGLKRR